MFRYLIRRLHIAMYDVSYARAERAGLTEERRALLAGATGATIEIGAGTGLNLRHYLPTVSRLVLTEPDRNMLRQLVRRRGELGVAAQIVAAEAEHLPFPDGSFDTAVVTFTLCSVHEENVALAELARVLAPGGRLLFMEHVRSADPAIAARQDSRPFLYRAVGCHPNRDTLASITASPLSVESVRHGEVRMAPELERPMIVGTGRRPAG